MSTSDPMPRSNTLALRVRFNGSKGYTRSSIALPDRRNARKPQETNERQVSMLSRYRDSIPHVQQGGMVDRHGVAFDVCLILCVIVPLKLGCPIFVIS